jgi:RND family efflux transporter MFP subunit
VDNFSVSNLKDELDALRIDRDPEGSGAGRWLAGLVILIVAAGAGALLWQWWSRERPIAVDIVTVTERAPGTQASVLNATGYVTARRRATVSSKITGKVIEVNVEEGMAVREGQVLARLDDSTVRAGLALAEAQLAASRQDVRELDVRLAEAELTLVRREMLMRDGFTAQETVDQARAEVDSLGARIDAARSQITVAERQVELREADLADTVIRAPFSGIAITKDAQPGEMVSPVSAGGGFTRTGICTIVDMTSLEIEVDVNESYINRVRENQDVTAVLDAYPDWEIPARVITTVPTADRQTATVLVRIGFRELDPRILPDMGVRITFLREGSEGAGEGGGSVPLVSRQAIFSADGLSYVFVVNGDRVERRAIGVGGNDGDRIEVTAGLRAGERVVVAPSPELSDGVLVQINGA